MTSGLTRVGLGTMMFGRWGNPDEAECARMVDIALERGVTLFDTADIHDFGRSEEILGRALAGRCDGFTIATKVGNPMSDDPSQRGLSRQWIRNACDASRRRLGIDQIDLYQMHRPDPETPLDETLAALHELVTEGRIGAVGTSTFTVHELDATRRCAEALGVTVPTMEQPPYSILCRGLERAVLPWCAGNGVGVLVWAPLNGGWLTGKYQSDALDADSRARRESDHFDHRVADVRARKQLLVGRLIAVADAAGLTLVQLALGFVLSDPTVTAILLGPRTPAQLLSLLDAAATGPLDSAILAAIDDVVAQGVTVNPADDGRS